MDREQAMTIEDLAARVGMTVRNVRNYQTKRLIPPPELQGRKGLYGNEHAVRLELIKEMQAAGYNLTSIKNLLDRVPPGAGEEALRLERALLSSWSEEESDVVGAAELAERFGNPGPEMLDRAALIGVIRVLDDGRVELPVPSLVRAGQQVMSLGVPLEDVLSVTEELVASSDRVAAAYVELFIRNIWQPFDESGRPADQWPKVRAALERLRPLASEALLGAFQARMSAAVEEALGSGFLAYEEDDEAAG